MPTYVIPTGINSPLHPANIHLVPGRIGAPIRMPETGNPPSGILVVPNVIGLTSAAASAALVAVGYVPSPIVSVLNDAPPGIVFAQSPAAGTLLPALSDVGFTVSLGREVPNVVNTSLTPVATADIVAAGLTVGFVTYASSVLIIAGNVISQSIPPGTFVPGGTPLNLVVSTGRASLVVPDLLGDTEAQALTALLSVGLVLGAVSSAPNLVVPVGEVMAQNPSPGTPVASGSIVSIVLSLGIPVVPPNFDFEATVISQYANSPTILQLVQSMNGYIDQTQNFADFYNFVWNVDTAQGFGLDIWGRIVNVSRLLQIPTGQRYVGFQDGTGPAWDVEPFGALAGGPTGGQGVWYTPIAATESYLLEDEPYRQLILTKALANIVNTTVPAFNQLLQNLFPGRGNPYVTGSQMAMVFNFDFDLTPIELAILQQSGAVPIPPGVSFTIVTP